MLQPTAIAQEFFWGDLLEYIGERRVIPIVGAELLTVPDGAGGEAPLMRVLALRLAERLRVPAEDCTGDDALHQVVSRYVQRGGRREEVYPRIRTLIKELAPPVPPVLRELARIRHFNVFVSTTFDSLSRRRSTRSVSAAPPAPSPSPTRRAIARTSRPTRHGTTRRRCSICSVACRRRRTMLSPRKTRWNFSPRSNPSRGGQTCCSMS